MLSYTCTPKHRSAFAHASLPRVLSSLSYAACMREPMCVHAVVRGLCTPPWKTKARHTRTHLYVCPHTPTNFATHTIALLPRVASGFMGIQPIEHGVGSPGMFAGQISLQDKLSYLLPGKSPHVS